MSFTEALGYLASALVLATFCMRDMVALRCMAIASNLAFVACGALADLGPVLVLHLLLLPVNVQRLMAWRSSMQAAAAPHHPCNFKEPRHE
jgi:CRP/FNR family transcriptional regulator, cyclic AMP receptor protein